MEGLWPHSDAGFNDPQLAELFDVYNELDVSVTRSTTDLLHRGAPPPAPEDFEPFGETGGFGLPNNASLSSYLHDPLWPPLSHAGPGFAAHPGRTLGGHGSALDDGFRSPPELPALVVPHGGGAYAPGSSSAGRLSYDGLSATLAATLAPRARSPLRAPPVLSDAGGEEGGAAGGWRAQATSPPLVAPAVASGRRAGGRASAAKATAASVTASAAPPSPPTSGVGAAPSRARPSSAAAAASVAPLGSGGRVRGGRGGRGAAVGTRDVGEVDGKSDRDNASVTSQQDGQQGYKGRRSGAGSDHLGAGGGRASAVPLHAPRGDESSGLPAQGGNKKRFLWTDDLHCRFVSAIFDFGLKSASPKILFELMQPCPTEMTSDHIKSHLQKFRNNSQVGKDMFLLDFERARREAEARSAERAAANGTPALPVQFSTYPISVPRDRQQASSEGGGGGEHADSVECTRCDRFAQLITLGVGIPEREEDAQEVTRAAHAFAASRGAAYGGAPPYAASSGAAFPAPRVGAAYPPGRNEAVAGMLRGGASLQHAAVAAALAAVTGGMQGIGPSGFAHAIAQAGARNPASLAPPQQAGAPVRPGADVIQPAVAQQLIALLKKHLGQAQGEAAAAALAPPLHVPPPPPLAGGEAEADVGMDDGAASTASSSVGGGPNQQSLSYADLLLLVRQGPGGQLRGGVAARQASSPSQGSSNSSDRGHAEHSGAGPTGAFAAMSRAMAAQMRMHRAMMHRQEGQLVTYGAEDAPPPQQAASSGVGSSRPPGGGRPHPGGDAMEEGSMPPPPTAHVRRASVESDSSGSHSSGGKHRALSTASLESFEAPVTPAELLNAFGQGGAEGLGALFRQRFGLDVLYTGAAGMGGGSAASRVTVQLPSGRHVTMPTSAAAAAGLLPPRATGASASEPAVAPLAFFQFLRAVEAPREEGARGGHQQTVDVTR